MRYLTVKLDKFAIEWAKKRVKVLKLKPSLKMSTIEEQNKGRKEGEIRYLTPLNISTTKKKYCRFKRSG